MHLTKRIRPDGKKGCSFLVLRFATGDLLDKGVRFIFESFVLAKLFTHMSRKSVSGAIALAQNDSVTSQVVSITQ